MEVDGTLSSRLTFAFTRFTFTDNICLHVNTNCKKPLSTHRQAGRSASKSSSSGTLAIRRTSASAYHSILHTKIQAMKRARKDQGISCRKTHLLLRPLEVITFLWLKPHT